MKSECNNKYTEPVTTEQDHSMSIETISINIFNQFGTKATK